MRRVEGAAPLPITARHQRLEGLAEHLRIHRQLGPIGSFLSRGEPIAGEEVAEEPPHLLVGEMSTAQATLVRRAREESAIEKGNAPERASGWRTARGPRVQRAEEEGREDAAVKAATCRHAGVEDAVEIRPIAIEPSLCLEKAEEEQAGAVEECEVPAFFPGSAIERCGERFDAILERAIEATGERFASQDLDPALMCEDVGIGARISGGGKRRERFGIAVDDSIALRDERGDAWGAAVGAPRGDRDG